MKTQCQRCGTVKTTPLIRWFGGSLFLSSLFAFGGYLLYSSLSILWPLFMMPFIDYDVATFTFAVSLIPGYLAYAWVVGKLIK
jgi:hypothetical protein